MSDYSQSTSDRKRWRNRWIIFISLLTVAIAAGAIFIWSRSIAAPLSAEEQAFVGVWQLKKPFTSPLRSAETVAHEFRPDRKVIYHHHDPATGERFTEDMGVTWRAEGGKIFYVTRDPRPVWSLINNRPQEFEWDVTWADDDHMRMALVHYGGREAPANDWTRVKANHP